jgi:hypothetical protein
MRTPAVRRRRRAERGLAMAITLFALATLLMAAATASLIASADMHATRNYRAASQAHFVAESGISHVIQVVNGIGVVDFKNEIVDNWGTVFGTASRDFGVDGYRYSVAVFQDAADPSNRGYFRATGTGTDGSQNVVVARILRANIPNTAPGAVYLASQANTNATFNGDAWQVSGNDYNYTGGMGSASPVPGISTRTDANTQEAIDSLNNQQMNNVTGLGYQAGPPIVPSLATSPAAPTPDQLSEIVDTLLSQPNVVTNNSSTLAGNQVFGLPQNPRITYFPQSVTVKGTGTVSGAGIMIVDGDLDIKGDLNFKGLIIVRGKTSVTADSESQVTGNATLYGSLWTNDINLVVGGSAIIRYSTQALALANLTVVTGALPAPVQVVSLADCAQLPAGAGGCP